jgi:branched-chain amino acid aminotransferase
MTAGNADGKSSDLIWLDGGLVDRATARFDPGDRGLLLGDGLFETILVRSGHAQHLEMHLQRLGDSASRLGIPLPIDAPGIAVAVDHLLTAKALHNGPAALRITLTRGAGYRGLLPPDAPQPHLLMTATPYHRPDQTGFTACLVSVRRNEGSPLSRIKSLNYLDNVLALQEAVAAGADEGLLCNNAGFLCCGSRTNLFVVRKGRLLTPPLTDGVLDGIQRRIVLQRATEARYPVLEQSLTPTDLSDIDEAFVTNSLLGIMPLTRIEERDLAIGPVTRALIDLISRP